MLSRHRTTAAPRPAPRRRLARLALLVPLALASCSKSEPAQPAQPAQPAAPATPTKASKDPAAARALLASGAVVLDVRTADEYAGERLPDATNIPIDELAGRLAEVEKLTGGDKARPIVVYCASGGRAGRAKRQLDEAGYTRVVNGGGLDDLR